MAPAFSIAVSSPQLEGRSVTLTSDANFRLGDSEMETRFVISLPPHERDLLRIAMAVYTADRLVKRRPRRGEEGLASREIDLRVDVSDPSFWGDQRTQHLLLRCLEHLSRDAWKFEFQADRGRQFQQPLFPMAEKVVPYSGGLDSCAGLAAQLRADAKGLLTITAAHQPAGSRIGYQLQAMAHRYGVRIHSMHCWTRLKRPPKHSEQESTQRSRAFLFASLAGAVASASCATYVDVMENGIGAINLPPQFGMSFCSMSTRGCQPAFTAAMTALLQHAVSRKIAYRLPNLGHTKAELVGVLVEDGLGHLIPKTVSCVHFPQRVPGQAKQCGTCFACIGRRQALLGAGVNEPGDSYRIDILGPRDGALYDVGNRTLDPLKACLQQVVDILAISDGGPFPAAMTVPVEISGVLNIGWKTRDVLRLYQRYAREWMTLIHFARARQVPWSRWIRPEGLAA